jgi:hypothetical protein
MQGLRCAAGPLHSCSLESTVVVALPPRAALLAEAFDYRGCCVEVEPVAAHRVEYEVCPIGVGSEPSVGDSFGEVLCGAGVTPVGRHADQPIIGCRKLGDGIHGCKLRCTLGAEGSFERFELRRSSGRLVQAASVRWLRQSPLRGARVLRRISRAPAPRHQIWSGFVR